MTDSNTRFFDVHCHIQEREFDTDRAEVIGAMRAGGVEAFVVGTDTESSRRAVALADKHDGLYATIGVHPTDNATDAFSEETFGLLAGSKKVVGVGECGLDYFRMKGDAEEQTRRQKALFEAQLAFAVMHRLPLMIHCRDAHDDMIDILSAKKKEYGDKLWGNIHFFTADIPTATRYLELGFSMSFPGVITFAHDYDEVVRFVPEDMILSETDTPFATPVPHRGTRNDPTNVALVAEKIAELRGVSPEHMGPVLVANARRIFKL